MRCRNRFPIATALLAAVLLGSALACSSPQYGGKQVSVTLTTLEQKLAGEGQAPKGADAYLLTLDQWLGMRGPDRMAEIERLRLEANATALAESTRNLLVDLAKYKRAMRTPVEVQVGPRTHCFVAAKDGQVRSVEFDPVRTKDREAIVSFPTEG